MLLIESTKVIALNLSTYMRPILLIVIFYQQHLAASIEGYAIDNLPNGQQQLTSKTQAQDLNVKLLPSQNLPQIQQQQQQHDQRRPIWALAHMVNSIKELDYRLSKGANAVEVDVTFGRDGDPLYTYHGPPCDCWRHCHQQENFNDYLSYIREIAIDELDGVGRNLSILFLDLKLDYLDQRGKIKAGTELARSVLTHLYLDSQVSEKLLHEKAKLEELLNNSTATVLIPRPKNALKLILSINHVTDLELVHNFLHYFEQNNATHILDRIGFDVGMNDDIQQIESMWKKFGNTLNIWQGDGYTNCFSPFYNLERLTRALTKRDNHLGYPRKVYHWTIDLHDRMRESLKLGVDAVMTNHPERLLAVLHEPEIAHDFRLATRADDPFKKIVSRSSSRSSETARYQRSTSPSQGGFFGSLIDVLSSWYAYIKEIPFFSLPTTSRFMPKVKRHKSETIVHRSSKSENDQPEYRINSNSTTQQTNSTAIENSSSGASDSIEKVLLEENPYEGPKWYTSLASNVLITMMKMLLPA